MATTSTNSEALSKPTLPPTITSSSTHTLHEIDDGINDEPVALVGWDSPGFDPPIEAQHQDDTCAMTASATLAPAEEAGMVGDSATAEACATHHEAGSKGSGHTKLDEVRGEGNNRSEPTTKKGSTRLTNSTTPR
jgi:hypothetical protein